MNVQEIITDEEIEKVWGGAHFGSMQKRDIVNQAVLKCASGYYQGKTSTQIITELGLINEQYNLTPKGKIYLWEAFCLPNTV